MRITALLLITALPCAALAQDVAPSTPDEDRGWLEGIIEDNLSSPGVNVDIRGFQGALSSRATLQELTIADDDGVWLTLRDVVLDWNRSALFRRQFQVTELTAAEIIVARTPKVPEGLEAAPAPEATPFSLPQLPVSVNVGRIAADRLELGEGLVGEDVVASLEGALSLANGEGSITLDIARTDGQELSLDLEASYANENRQLVTNLTVAEGADGLVTRKLGLPGAPSIDLTVAGTGPIDDFTANIALATDEQPRLAGDVRIQSPVEGPLGFAADLSGNAAPLFLPDYAEFFGDNLALKVEGSQSTDGVLDIPAVSLVAQQLALNGAVTIGADGLPDRIDLTGRIAAPDGQPVLLPLTTEQETRVTSADLEVAFDAAQSEDWRGGLRITGLDRADFDADTLALDGTGRIVAGAAQQVTADLTLAATGLAAADPALNEALGPTIQGGANIVWVQGEDGLRLSNLALDGEDYGLTADAVFQGLSTGMTITGNIGARFADISRAATLAGRPLAGAATATVSGRYTVLEGGFDAVADVTGTDLQVGIDQVDGLLGGTSTIHLSTLRDTAGTRIRDLTVNAQGLTAEAQGLIASTGSDLTANIDARDLSVLGAPYAGAAAAAVTFTGTPEAGEITLTADGTDIRTGIAEADGLLRGASSLRLDAALDNGAAVIRQAVVNARALDLTAEGRLSTEGSDVTARLNLSDLTALGRGYSGAVNAVTTFQGTPENARVTVEGQARNISVAQAEADRLLRGNSTISAAAQITNGTVIVERANVQNPQITVNATGTAAQNGQDLNLTARLANLGLLVPQFPGAVTVSGTVQQRPDRYGLDLTAQGPGGINARVNGDLGAAFDRADLSLTGAAQAALANAFLSPRSVAGPVQFDLRVNGPLALESVNGTIRTQGARFADPELNLAMNAIDATVTLAGPVARITASAAPEDGGSISVGGSVGLADPFNSDLTVTLNRAVFSDPTLYRTTTGGTVRLTGPLAGNGTVAGNIVLEETEVQVPSGGLGGAGTLPRLQHVNETAPVRSTRARARLLDEDGRTQGSSASAGLNLDLTISAPNRIFVRGRGLESEFGGQLRLTGTTNNIVPIGAFELVRGRLDILGRRLNLSEAAITMEGEFVPYLNIRAASENSGVTSYVNIVGPADAPEVTFSSTPELPQEEVLAQLLFGRDLSSISPFQAAQLASAVATLAGRGGDGIIGNLRKSFGLDDLDVTTNDSGDAAVRAGKYIAADTYTEVQVDSQGQSEISLNYDLTDNVTVRGSTGTGDGSTGLGIFYERDY
ncbi:translocation/assembly module TamB domain-containing protein [Falsirhodobacter halotolerans]|uniref:translocation/assembly module TamB domain-containing protein n=1 Tax=Falsirhodobacter halotolerans TaxID=1146892 RepID=UPI001FD1DD73|nr:translocation/assembly module TamB domain-containing protein [Falsirhodobacter halotolerans]MCJ8138339.1 translocation/assembly module TamB domain-containing protein [Falsirhodobacter halotolerans]